MDPWDVLITLGISLGLGLIVGLQREYALSSLAGIRTFALITLLGTITALLSKTLGPWTLAAGFIALAALMIAGNITKRLPTDPHHGITTEVAALVMYAVGAYLAMGVPGDRHIAIALAIGGTVALLLQLKQPLHSFVQRLGETDIKAIMQFVLIAVVILPILPNTALGPPPYNVLNPREMWLVVVLIVAISLGGYVAHKLLGERVGTLLAGILGGCISSTATTVSYSRFACADPATTSASTFIIMLATAVSTLRVMVLALLLAPAHADALWAPFTVMVGLTVLLSVVAYFRSANGTQPIASQRNPAELRSALMFALMYAVVKFAVAVAKGNFGSSGLYVLAAISGLTDLDAITLSTAGMIQATDAQAIAPGLGWRIILVAMISNLVFKAGITGVLGTRSLLRRVTLLFGLTAAGAVVLILLWW